MFVDTIILQGSLQYFKSVGRLLKEVTIHSFDLGSFSAISRSTAVQCFELNCLRRTAKFAVFGAFVAIFTTDH